MAIVKSKIFNSLSFRIFLLLAFLILATRLLTPTWNNQNWLAVTRPMLEAFFHARYFLEMAVKYGKELDSPPQMLPSGWASLLYLYNMR